MFVKIGSGIFDVSTIKSVVLNEDEINVNLKDEDEEITVDKNPSDNSFLDNIVVMMNKKEV